MPELNVEYQAQNFTLSAVTGYQHLKDRMFLDQDFTAKNTYTLEQKQRINTISEEIVMKSKEATAGKGLQAFRFLPMAKYYCTGHIQRRWYGDDGSDVGKLHPSTG